MNADAVNPSDRELAERVLTDGSELAFRALYRRHTPALYAFALRMLGGAEHDAEDVVQDTWVKAGENLRGFRWESSLRTWLIGIALNLCRMEFRRRDRGRPGSPEAVVDVAPAEPEEVMDLEAALRRLPDGYRAVLVLHDVEGFKHHEIAARLGIAPGTSKSQLSRGRQLVRRMMGRRAGPTEREVRDA